MAVAPFSTPAESAKEPSARRTLEGVRAPDRLVGAYKITTCPTGRRQFCLRSGPARFGSNSVVCRCVRAYIGYTRARNLVVSSKVIACFGWPFTCRIRQCPSDWRLGLCAFVERNLSQPELLDDKVFVVEANADVVSK